MKKFLLIVLFLCFLAVGGVVAMVMMSFNPSAYERDVVGYLQKLTGRNVSVGGTTAISWNPEPTVTMNDIKITNIDKSKNPVMLSIDKVTVAIAWKSLLKSPLEIKRIEVVKPVLYLERLESNRANYTFPFLLDSNFQLQEMEMLTDASSTTAKIEEVLIREGTVDYDNQVTGAHFQVTGINGSLGVDSVRGPYRFKGTAIKDKGQYSLSANVGLFQGSSPISIGLQLSENNTRSELNLTGNFTPTSGDKWFDGAANFNVGRLDALLTDLALPVPDLSAGSTASGSTTILIAPATDTLKDFVIQIGEGDKRAAFTGTVKRTVSTKKYAYDIDMATDIFRWEQWKSYFDSLNWNWISGEGIYPNIRFKAIAQSVPFSGDTVKNLAVEGNYANSILTIEKSSATLPGGGKVDLIVSGKPSSQEAQLDFGIRAEVPDTQSTLKWLLGDRKWAELPALAQKGTFTGRVTWQPKEVIVSAEEFKIGEAGMTGSIQKALDEQSLWTAKLVFNNVNLDAYTGWTASEKPVSLGELPTIIQNSLINAKGFEGLNIQAAVDMNEATVFGVPVKRIYGEGTLNNRVLKVERVIAQGMAGADVAIGGTFNGIGESQMNVDDFQLGLKTKQLSAFLKRMNLVSILPLINEASDANFRLALKGGKEGAWGIDTLAELSNASIRLKGGLTTGEVLNVEDMSFEITHPNFQRFMKLLDSRYDLLPKLDGTFKTTGVVSGSKDHFEFNGTTVAIGLQQLNGSLSFDNHEIKTLVADIKAPSLDLERFTNDVNPFYSEVNGLSKKPLDLSALNDWNMNVKLNASQLIYKDVNIRQADVQMALQNKEMNLIKLTGISGASDKSPVNITAKLDWNTTPTFTTNFDIQNIPLRSDFMVLPELVVGGGTLSLNGELKARGETPADFITNLNGQGVMSLQGGQMIGADIEGMIPVITLAIQRTEGAKAIEPEFKRVLNSGKTVLGTLKGDYVISNGVVRMMDLTMETRNAFANPTQIVWDIPKRTLDISIPVLLKPLNSLPAFVLGISVSAGRSTYKPNYSDLLNVLSNRSQTALAKDMRQKEEAARAASIRQRTERLADSKKLTIEARQAVVGMERKMAEFPFEKGRRLLAGAKDTLTLLDQLSVKDNPTDAQLEQQKEYAKIILLKYDEFRRILEQETLFNAQKQMAGYRQKSNQLTDQLNAWAKGYPDIIVLVKLAENAEQNHQIIEQSAAELKPNLSVAEANGLLATCAEALEKIEKAYQHATRFDLSGVPNQVAGETPNTTHQVRGSFKRSE